MTYTFPSWNLYEANNSTKAKYISRKAINEASSTNNKSLESKIVVMDEMVQ